MFRRWISTMLMLIPCSITAFAHTAIVPVSGGNQYQAVRLTAQIYNNANRDLSDLRLQDGDGKDVPYFIHSGSEKEYEDTVTAPMDLIQSYTKDSSFYFDYQLTETGESDTIATSIRFTTADADFAKVIDVYGSYDNLNWEHVCEDKLYVIDSSTKLSIEFEEPQKFTHYRFKLANNLEKISFNTVELIYNMKTSESGYFIESFSPAYEVEEKDQTTVISIEGLKNLRLCDITIETDSMFKRMVHAPLVQGKELYHLSLNGVSYTDTSLPLDWQIPEEERYVLTIANHDDSPILIKGITVRYYADEVVFQGTAGETYMLSFGADETKSAPVYDIGRYQDEILKGPVDQAVIETIRFEQTQETEPPKEKDYRLIFNLIVIVTAFLLGGVIVLRLKARR